jgi:hypothetical protein
VGYETYTMQDFRPDYVTLVFDKFMILPVMKKYVTSQLVLHEFAVLFDSQYVLTFKLIVWFYVARDTAVVFLQLI